MICRALCGLIFATTALPATAMAYRTLGEQEGLAEGVQLRWSETINYRTPSQPSPGLDVVGAERAIGVALSSWTSLGCGLPSTRNLGRGGAPASGDGTIDVVFVRSRWASLGRSPEAAATTDVVYEVSPTGAEARIVDADIFINAEHYRWSVDGSATTQSLTSALVHELGHALGLAHPCELTEIDTAPRCGGDEADVIMDPRYQAGATPTEDDRAGLCTVYGESMTPCGAGCGAGSDCMSGRCVPHECALTPCRACRFDTDCGAGAEEPPSSCIEGYCVPLRAEGDPCDRGLECASEVCLDDRCAPRCTARSCADDERCTARGRCERLPDDFLASCTSADACMSGLCVSRVPASGDTPFCTVWCADTTPCPTAFACADVEGARVCVPPGSSSCGVGIGGGSRTLDTRAMGALLVLLFAARRRLGPCPRRTS